MRRHKDHIHCRGYNESVHDSQVQEDGMRRTSCQARHSKVSACPNFVVPGLIEMILLACYSRLERPPLRYMSDTKTMPKLCMIGSGLSVCAEKTSLKVLRIRWNLGL